MITRMSLHQRREVFDLTFSLIRLHQHRQPDVKRFLGRIIAKSIKVLPTCGLPASGSTTKHSARNG
ncbi:hypothetical protein CSKR_113468 [Clonorchis sinensis]|uniref:Uncharacterized protein n=1 Tax=Clonorchis sinensis TaxID=79923 RepID=A0A3R7C0Z0_CLOSI|nr:hypothetical protein CSKR_113468 [Clonorchis sinensis]